MNSTVKLDPNRLFIFHEGRKRRLFVGELIYLKEKDSYVFIYDKNYVRSKKAISISPELDIFKIHHESPKGKLFPSFVDRIPLKTNPAYKDYCSLQGVSPNEKNPIILLGSIGRRGPSSFVFEPVYKKKFSSSDISKIRKELKITQHDLAQAFGVNELTLQKIESGKSSDVNTLKLLQIYFEFPEVAIWQLKQTGGRIHGEILSKLNRYFSANSI